MYALINDFEYTVNNGNYDTSELVEQVGNFNSRFERPHPGRFPVKALLQAIPAVTVEKSVHGNTKAIHLKNNNVYFRPLLTSGDVLLAMHELLDPKMFQCGCISLPHAIKGPFVRDSSSGTYFRCVFRLNKPTVIYKLVPNMEKLKKLFEGLEALADIRSFLSPRYHQDVSTVNE